MEGLEKLRWAEALIREKTEGKQRLLAGWDGIPLVRIEDGCMVGLYFALLKNHKTGFYDCHVKGYIRTCGGYNPSARMKELTEECARIAALVAQLEVADIHGDALMNVLKGVAEIEMLCLNSREYFEENKSFLRKRAEEERNPVVRSLLERDQNFLDRIQVQMATAREFLIIIRLHNEKGTEVFSYLDHIEKSLKEQGFSSSWAGSEDIKRILAVYYEQNVTSEKFEDFDGERWIIPDD